MPNQVVLSCRGTPSRLLRVELSTFRVDPGSNLPVSDPDRVLVAADAFV